MIRKEQEVVYYRVQRVDILALMNRLIDQTNYYSFKPEDLMDWSGEMLCVCDSDDPAPPAEIREAMRVLYPRLEMVMIEGGEHGIALTHQDEYFKAIDTFFAR